MMALLNKACLPQLILANFWVNLASICTIRGSGAINANALRLTVVDQFQRGETGKSPRPFTQFLETVQLEGDDSDEDQDQSPYDVRASEKPLIIQVGEETGVDGSDVGDDNSSPPSPDLCEVSECLNSDQIPLLRKHRRSQGNVIEEGECSSPQCERLSDRRYSYSLLGTVAPPYPQSDSDIYVKPRRENEPISAPSHKTPSVAFGFSGAWRQGFGCKCRFRMHYGPKTADGSQGSIAFHAVPPFVKCPTMRSWFGNIGAPETTLRSLFLGADLDNGYASFRRHREYSAFTALHYYFRVSLERTTLVKHASSSLSN